MRGASGHYGGRPDDAVHGSTDFRVLSSAQWRCTHGSNLKCRKAPPCLGGAESSRGNFALRAFNAFVCRKSRRPHHYVDVAGEMEAWYWSELTIRHDAGKIYGSISVAAGSAMARSRYHRTKGNAPGISSGNFFVFRAAKEVRVQGKRRCDLQVYDRH